MHEIIDLDTIAGVWPQRAADISVNRLLALMDRHQVAQSCVVSAAASSMTIPMATRRRYAGARPSRG